MEPEVILLVREAFRMAASLYFKVQQQAGKSDAEIDTKFKEDLVWAKNFDPAKDIKDV